MQQTKFTRYVRFSGGDKKEVVLAASAAIKDMKSRGLSVVVTELPTTDGITMINVEFRPGGHVR